MKKLFILFVFYNQGLLSFNDKIKCNLNQNDKAFSKLKILFPPRKYKNLNVFIYNDEYCAKYFHNK